MEDKLRGLLTYSERPHYTLAHGDLTPDNILVREVRTD